MNFAQLKSWFIRYFDKANEFGLGWIFAIIIVLLLVWYISKGNKLNIRIPFLPRFMNKVSISKDDLEGVKEKGSSLLKRKQQQHEESTVGDSGIKEEDIPNSKMSSLWQLISGAHEERYQQPTFLLIGDDDTKADKKILKELKPLLGRKEVNLEKKFGGTQENWYFYDQGTLVHGANLNRTIPELQQYRPERPLDGMIITLSAKKLRESDRTGLESWANEIYQKIWETQKRLGFILPIYLLVTQTEELTGFKSFWNQKELQDRHDEQFGWANPYGTSEAYQTSWVGEAISTLSRYVRNVQLSIIQGDGNKTFKDDVEALLFGNQLDNLQANLTIFCDELFAHTVLQSPLMLRSIHFTGKKDVKPESAPQYTHHMFVKDWLEKKVFLENEIAFAPRSRLISSNAKLRSYQYSSIVTFVVLLGLLTLDGLGLKDQTDNLVTAISTEPKPQGKPDISYVNSVINHIAHMDAGEIKYISMPLSWNSPFNDKLVEYFAEHTFDEVLFPAMECTMQDQLALRLEKLNSVENAMGYGDWLDNVSLNFQKRHDLDNLIYDTQDPTLVLDKLTDLVDYLYQEKLPDSFYSRSDLYVQAISLPFERQSKNPFCHRMEFDQRTTWENIKQTAEREISQIADDVKAPNAFFLVGEELQSLPSVIAWYNSIPEFSNVLKNFNGWLEHLRKFWLLDHIHPNECQRIHDALRHLGRVAFKRDPGYAEKFANQCLDEVSRVIENDNATLIFPLYKKMEYPMVLTNDATQLFESVSDLNSLSYILNTTEIERSPFRDDFFWSTEQLNRALALQEEYETYALANYKNIWLPKKNRGANADYFAQGVALKQLQFAMNRYILQAQIKSHADYNPEHLRPVDQQEAYLAAAIGNFSKSMDSILALLQSFKKLEFVESYKWLEQVSQDHAFSLLKQVDILYNKNQIYRPLDKARWSAHQYTDVLFGITNEGQLQDYIAARSGLASDIAVDYAEPLIVFLLNTEGKYQHYELFGKWQNTLIELNKKQSQNPANSLDILESLMRDQLSNIDQSNCFEKTKELEAPTGSDLFSVQQRVIISRATSHCDSYKADQIKHQYAQVVELFNKYLAGKAPFSRMAKARQVSPQDMKQFLKAYMPVADGLSQRMSILAWKDKRNKKAQTFVSNLDKAAAVFNNMLGATDGKESLGLELDVAFNVLDKEASFVRHLSNWQLQVGSAQIGYPGTPTPVYWRPGDNIDMSLAWAEQSPYKAFAVNGSSRLQNRLQYASSGTWSILEFINRHQAKVFDSEALNDHSTLLGFEAKVLARDAESKAPEPNQLLAFARLVAYGIDPETQQKVELEIPKQFPDHAPKSY